MGGFGGDVGWEEKQEQRRGRGGGRKKILRLAPIKAGGVFFRLRLAAAVTDGCVCACVHGHECLCACVHIVAGLIRQRFLGTQEDVGEGPCGS